MKESDPRFDDILRTLMDEFGRHIKDEEVNDLPKLENALVGEESQRLVYDFERAKMFVPSRSHPSTPDRPPFETVAGLMFAPIDHLGDIFRKFPRTSTPSQGSPN